jgi:hypothetical protein
MNFLLVRKSIKKLFRAAGWDVVSYDPRFNSEARKWYLLKTMGIKYILDIGANEGQYAQYLRAMGYHGRIASFEPLSVAYEQLLKRMQRDPRLSSYE